MKKLNYELKSLCERNADGSYATRSKRFSTLQGIARTLNDLGFKDMSARSLKPKHVERLVDKWLADGMSSGAIKNNMTSVRWWAEKVNKASVVSRDNAAYGIPDRKFVTGKDKSTQVQRSDLAKIKDPYVRLSVELQKAFGLRREEAIKFQPSFAMKNLESGYISLKSSWTKGGKARIVPLNHKARNYQLQVLNKVKVMCGSGSLIPAEKSYIQQLGVYKFESRRAGLSGLHGLRHLYAQTRYEELTGRLPPAKGGPLPRELDPNEKVKDHEVRLMISRELGHERKQIVAVYLGG